MTAPRDSLAQTIATAVDAERETATPAPVMALDLVVADAIIADGWVKA
jgi:hypothetical protein